MTLAVASRGIKSEVMDHHGLVAAVCRDLKIAERINERVGSPDPRRVVQAGVSVVAMIINGLGFTNRRLYLTPQFYQSKAIGQLLGEGVSAQDLDDHALGKALDEISEYGATRLFGELAFELGIEQGLLGKLAHVDTTSFSLHGQYEGEEAGTVEITRGYSRDHRPDLKQIILSLAMTGPANLPVWMDPKSGNSSDKKSLHETIESVRAFQRQLKTNHDFRWIADSGLYTADKLLACNQFKWISRVPETVKECRSLLEKESTDFKWVVGDGGYSCTEVESGYGGIRQRWLMVYSKQAYAREKKTFDKRLEKQKERLEKACWHLGNKIFNCQKDAEKEVKVLQKSYLYHQIKSEVVAIEKHAKRGRPNAKTAKEIKGYRVNCHIEANQVAVDKRLTRKGRFVLATNDMDQEALSSCEILHQYKQQQNVENGFRFLKDPWFMVDSFYLKKRKRIEALMMVMTLCLLVYNFAQYRLRKALQEKSETLPNQLGKPVKNPTMRWVFQIMEGIGIIKMYDAGKQLYRSMITNLDGLRQKIIRLMGETACKIYGIRPEIAGM